MTPLVIVVCAAGAIVTVVASWRLAQLNREIRQARRLYQQMEEDHAQLVKLILAIRERVDGVSK